MTMKTRLQKELISTIEIERKRESEDKHRLEWLDNDS